MLVGFNMTEGEEDNLSSEMEPESWKDQEHEGSVHIISP